MENLDIKKKKKEPIRIGIDLGTANLLVFVEGQGVIFNEPSVIAMDYQSGDVIAVGNEAARMLGRGHDKIKIVKPLNQGVISDMDAATKLLEFTFKKLEDVNADLKSSTVLICCPSEVTQVERESMANLAKKIGVPDVFIEEEVKAGAIGAGIDIFKSRGSMVIDIGGGSTDIGVLALGDIVVSDSVRIAGNYFDSEIINYLQFKHGLLVGPRTAENVKKECGTLRKDLKEDTETDVSGRDLISGLPRRMKIKKSEIRSVLLPAFEELGNKVLKVLQNTPPELSRDIIEDGIIVNGGGSLIDGVDEFFHEITTLDIKLAKNPLTSIVEGTRTLLKNRGNYLVKPVD